MTMRSLTSRWLASLALDALNLIGVKPVRLDAPQAGGLWLRPDAAFLDHVKQCASAHLKCLGRFLGVQHLFPFRILRSGCRFSRHHFPFHYTRVERGVLVVLD
jgi:hypothetical protein